MMMKLLFLQYLYNLSDVKVIEEAREVLYDKRFIAQKGVRSLVDKDARVGNKSKTSQFYSYKAEYTMTADERIITLIDVHSGDYVDGREFSKLIEQTFESGVSVTELYGDKAYFRKDILDLLESKKIEGYIPVSSSVYKIDEELFSYNKDSDQWFCFMGNNTVSCKKTITGNGRGDKYETFIYTFDKVQCVNCPHRDECMKGKKAKARKLSVSVNARIYYEMRRRQKKKEFLEKYKSVLRKNGKTAK